MFSTLYRGGIRTRRSSDASRVTRHERHERILSYFVLATYVDNLN
jgi:hypothetical protein